MINTRAGSIGLALAILLSLAGLVLTGLLLEYQARNATGGEPILRGLCTLGSADGRDICREVLTSRWSSFPFRGDAVRSVPMAWVGFVYFAAVSAWFLIVGRPSGSRAGWHWFAALLTAGGTALAAYLAYMTYRHLPAVCPVCMAVLAIVGLLFLVTLTIWPRRQLVQVMAEPVSGVVRGPVPVRLPRPASPPGRAFIAWAMMTAAVSLLGWMTYQELIHGGEAPRLLAHSNGTSEENTPLVDNLHRAAEAAVAQAGKAEAARAALAMELEIARSTLQQARDDGQTTQPSGPADAAAQKTIQDLQARLDDYEKDYQAVWFNFMNEPVVDIPVDPTDSIRGKVDAPHTVVMYMDLQCPYCQAADRLLREKLRKYQGRLRLAVKHFPLNKTCNEGVTGNTHPAACAAAVTVEAARALGGEDAFWKMYDELFAHPADFAKKPREFVQEACAKIGIDNDELWKKINTTSIWNRIKEQARQGGQIGVQATPAIYYDGRRVAGWANSRFWDFIMYREQQMGGGPVTRPGATQPQ